MILATVAVSGTVALAAIVVGTATVLKNDTNEILDSINK